MRSLLGFTRYGFGGGSTEPLSERGSYEEERGYPPYDPRLMTKLLIYGYANGVISSRKLEAATHRDVAVRMLCANQHPDYRSIARLSQAPPGGALRALRAGAAALP